MYRALGALWGASRVCLVGSEPDLRARGRGRQRPARGGALREEARRSAAVSRPAPETCLERKASMSRKPSSQGDGIPPVCRGRAPIHGLHSSSKKSTSSKLFVHVSFLELCQPGASIA